MALLRHALVLLAMAMAASAALAADPSRRLRKLSDAKSQRALEEQRQRIRRTFALQTDRVAPAGAIHLWPQGQGPSCLFGRRAKGRPAFSTEL